MRERTPRDTNLEYYLEKSRIYVATACAFAEGLQRTHLEEIYQELLAMKTES